MRVRKKYVRPRAKKTQDNRICGIGCGIGCFVGCGLGCLVGTGLGS